MAITSGARHTAHWITLAIDLVVIGGLCCYVQYKAKDRDPYPYSFWKKYGPAILCWISLPFIIADPLRHVLDDTNAWESCSRSCHELWPKSCHWTSNEYKCALHYGELFEPPYGINDQCIMCNRSTTINGTTHYEAVKCADYKDDFPTTCVHDDQETMAHLSTMGIVFTIIFTYFGFGMFMFANLWNADIIGKCRDIKHKYRVLRGLSEDDDY